MTPHTHTWERQRQKCVDFDVDFDVTSVREKKHPEICNVRIDISENALLLVFSMSFVLSRYCTLSGLFSSLIMRMQTQSKTALSLMAAGNAGSQQSFKYWLRYPNWFVCLRSC